MKSLILSNGVGSLKVIIFIISKMLSWFQTEIKWILNWISKQSNVEHHFNRNLWMKNQILKWIFSYLEKEICLMWEKDKWLTKKTILRILPHPLNSLPGCDEPHIFHVCDRVQEQLEPFLMVRSGEPDKQWYIIINRTI